MFNRDLDKAIINGKIENLYLFYGEEKYVIDYYVKKILSKSVHNLIEGVNYIKHNKQTIGRFISDCQTPSFLGENKIIVVTNSELMKAKKLEVTEATDNIIEQDIHGNSNSQIAEYIKKGIPNGVIVIFAEEKVDKKMKLFKAISEKGQVYEFELLKSKEMVQFLMDNFAKYKLNISKSTAEYMDYICGNDLNNIITEMRKMVSFKNQDKEITNLDIDSICVKSLQAKVFDLLDFIGQRKNKESIAALNDLIQQKEPLQKILIMIYSHFKNLYMIKCLVDKNVSLNISEELGLHPFVVSKAKYQINNFSQNKLKEILLKLTELDYNNKIGILDLKIGIEGLICDCI